VHDDLDRLIEQAEAIGRSDAHLLRPR
jgi:hypothetical protein